MKNNITSIFNQGVNITQLNYTFFYKHEDKRPELDSAAYGVFIFQEYTSEMCN